MMCHTSVHASTLEFVMVLVKGLRPIGILLDDRSRLTVHSKWRVPDVREAAWSDQQLLETGAKS